jgi:hypothetical protein
MIFLISLRDLLSYLFRRDVLLLVILMLFFIYNHHKRIWLLSLRMFNTEVVPPPKVQLKSTIFYGLIGGLIVSALFVLLGVSIPAIGLDYLWLVSVILLLFQPRFICFAYSGGIVGLLALILGQPASEVSSLMALVAILHLAEALLIRMSGADGCLPMYVKQADGKVVGGYALQKYWPIFFIALFAFRYKLASDTAVIHSDWWPLWPYPDHPSASLIGFIPLMMMAVLGYGDFTVSCSPKKKALMSSNNLLVFSLILLALAFSANYHPALAYLAVLFSPIGHELVIYKGRKEQKESQPIFTRDKGVMVMAVVPGSAASLMGVEEGDVIVEFNGEAIHTWEDLNTAMSPWALDVEMTVENAFTEERRRLSHHGKVPPLGIILAPKPDEKIYVTFTKSGWLKRLFRRRQKNVSA